MIFILNRGLILEQELVRAIKNYFSLIGVSDYYKNYTVNVTNEHPFARMLLSKVPEKDATSLFPVVVVATENDSKPSSLTELAGTGDVILEPEDIEENEDGGPSDIEKRYEMITPKIMTALRKAMDDREVKRIFGQSYFIRRSDLISIEIWAENPQLKNELYELVRLFVCGFMKNYLADLYKEYFSELNDGGESPLVIFDSSVRGQRSNNFNIDFGIELVGAYLTFDADYVIEQAVIDTEIVDANNILLEVINHVKDFEQTTRQWVIARGEFGESDIEKLTGADRGTKGDETGGGNVESKEDGCIEGEEDADG